MSLPFTRRQWTEAEPILDRALELTTQDRHAFLDGACGRASELRRRVERLVMAARDDEFLDTASHWSAVDALRSVGSERMQPSTYRGRRIGPYRILEELGRGGMGLVFLAERADGLWERRVALKLIRSEVPSAALVERFVHERRVLARLDHPYVVRLLDGGTTAAGFPYFAMELVEGLPITRYCDEARLDIGARLELFLGACEGVKHAHDRRVVHRDLKPSNIHVTADAQVKLLDFGVARIVRPDVDAVGMECRAPEPGPAHLTPEYAAPELFGEGAADPSSDVYSLGVVLYELLAGQRPYELPEGTQSEIEQLVHTVRPMKLSEAVTRPSASVAPDTLRAVSAARRTDARHLRYRLRGDLELILAKALSKDRALRYETVDAFAKDIRAHLRRRPIEAHGEGWLYNCRTLVGRRRRGIAATLVVLTSVAFGIVSTARETSRARTEAERARGVQQLLMGVLDGIAVEGGSIRSDPLHSLLLSSTEEVESNLVGQGLEQGEMLAALGVIFLHLGDREQGLDLVRRGLDLRNRFLLRPDSVSAVMDVRVSEALLEAGYVSQAEDHFKAALHTSRELFGPEARETTRVLGGLGDVASRRGDTRAAEWFYGRAVELDEQSGRPDRLLSARLAAGFARVLARAGRPWEAEPRQRKVLLAGLTAEPTDGSEERQAALDLAALRLRQGDVASADRLMSGVVEEERGLNGPAHRRVIEARRDLALSLLDLGGHEEAIALLTSVLEHDRRTGGMRGARALETQRLLAVAQLGAGLTGRAETTVRSLIESDGRAAADGRGVLMEILAEMGRIDEAVVELRRTIEEVEQPAGAASLRADAWLGLGSVLAKGGQCAEAEPMLRDGLAHRPGPVGRPLLRARAQIGLAVCLLEGDGDARGADTLLVEAYETLRPFPGHEREKRRALEALVRVRDDAPGRERYLTHLKALGGLD